MLVVGEMRDIVIIVAGIMWIVTGLFTAVLVLILVFIALFVRKLLKEDARDALGSLKETLDNVRGTTEFAGETVVSPIIRAYSVVSGVRKGVGVLADLPGFVGGRRRKGK